MRGQDPGSWERPYITKGRDKVSGVSGVSGVPGVSGVLGLTSLYLLYKRQLLHNYTS